MALQLREVAQLLAIVAVVSFGTKWWLSSQAKSAGAAVASAAVPGDIRMLSSVTCGVCIQARAWFQEHRVPFSECFIERDAACRAEMQAIGAVGTPVIVVRGKPIVGFSPAVIRDRLGG
jgi:glutaredoxin